MSSTPPRPAVRWVVVVLGGPIGVTAAAAVERDHLDAAEVRVLSSTRLDDTGLPIDDQAAALADLMAQWRAERHSLLVSLSRLPGVGRAIEDAWRQAMPHGVPVVAHPVPSLDVDDPWRADLAAEVHLALSRRHVHLDGELRRLLTDWTTTRTTTYDHADSPVPGDPTGLALPIALALHRSDPGQQIRIFSPVGVSMRDVRARAGAWNPYEERLDRGFRPDQHDTSGPHLVDSLHDLVRDAERRFFRGY